MVIIIIILRNSSNKPWLVGMDSGNRDVIVSMVQLAFPDKMGWSTILGYLMGG